MRFAVQGLRSLLLCWWAVVNTNAQPTGVRFIDAGGNDEDIDLVQGFTRAFFFNDTISGVPAELNPDTFKDHRSADPQAVGIEQIYNYSLADFGSMELVNVTLGFAENYVPNCKVGRRIFDISVNGESFSDNLDIFNEVGCFTALVISKTFTASEDGKIVIQFSPSDENSNPLISILQLEGLSTSAATPTPKAPTDAPVVSPTETPIDAFTDFPTLAPTGSPITTSTTAPVIIPTEMPQASTGMPMATDAPTDAPVVAPTDVPVVTPTEAPVTTPTDLPVPAPTDAPVVAPTGIPNVSPTDLPITTSTEMPIDTPSASPVAIPPVEETSVVFINSGGNTEDLDLVQGFTRAFFFNDTISGVPEGLDPVTFKDHRSADPDTMGVEMAFNYSLSGFGAMQEVNVTMGFAENFEPNCEVGRRVFDVSVNGESFVDNLDIFDEVGCFSALVVSKTFSASNDGMIVIQFSPSDESSNPLVSVLQIDVLSTGGNTPTPQTSTMIPVNAVTSMPQVVETSSPIVVTTEAPAFTPTGMPMATDSPTDAPVVTPTDLPVVTPTEAPVTTPTDLPVPAPTDAPVVAPTDIPNVSPTDLPITTSTEMPIDTPSASPVAIPPVEETSVIFINSGGNTEDLDLVQGFTRAFFFNDTISDVPEGLDPVLFKDHRSADPDTMGVAMVFNYSLSGFGAMQEVNVTMGFAENFEPNCEVGRRVFDVSVNGESFVDNLDIFDEVGCFSALVVSKTFTSTADGKVVIRFSPSDESSNPLVSILQIQQIRTTGPTNAVTEAPMAMPTNSPVISPTGVPVVLPSNTPVVSPTDVPGIAPSEGPVSLGMPTVSPVFSPTGNPAFIPNSSDAPVISSTSPILKTATPSAEPTKNKKGGSEKSETPTASPTTMPSESVKTIPSSTDAPASAVPVSALTTGPTVGSTLPPSILASDTASSEAPESRIPPTNVIDGAFVVDATTGETLAELKRGTSYDLDSLGSFLTVRLDTIGDYVGHVRFQWVQDGAVTTHIDRKAPYVMAGKESPLFAPVPYLATEGLKMLSVEVYHQKNYVLERKVFFFDVTSDESVRADSTTDGSSKPSGEGIGSFFDWFLDFITPPYFENDDEDDVKQ